MKMRTERITNETGKHIGNISHIAGTDKWIAGGWVYSADDADAFPRSCLIGTFGSRKEALDAITKAGYVAR